MSVLRTMTKENARQRQKSTARVGRHRFHGDPERFQVLADFVAGRFRDVQYIADVAGGQGLLSRMLNKRHNFEAEVVDPRGWVMKGVSSRPEEFRAEMAGYYDLVVGLHPDEAIREVVRAALERPTVVVPCCNFWDREQRLGRDELLRAIGDHHSAHAGSWEHVELAFRGPHNHALILLPPPVSAR